MRTQHPKNNSTRNKPRLRPVGRSNAHQYLESCVWARRFSQKHLSCCARHEFQHTSPSKMFACSFGKVANRKDFCGTCMRKKISIATFAFGLATNVQYIPGCPYKVSSNWQVAWSSSDWLKLWRLWLVSSLKGTNATGVFCIYRGEI
jgi:hypothetical protein